MVFENRFYATDEMYKEYVYKVICRKLVLNGGIIALVGIAGFIYFLKAQPVLSGMMGAAGFVSAFVVLSFPRMILKRLLEMDKKLSTGLRHESVLTFGDKIGMGEGDSNFAMEYSKIIGIYRLKTCGVLMFTKQNGLLYSEQGFVSGTNEEFQSFILEKCPNVQKIVKR